MNIRNTLMATLFVLLLAPSVAFTAEEPEEPEESEKPALGGFVTTSFGFGVLRVPSEYDNNTSFIFTVDGGLVTADHVRIGGIFHSSTLESTLSVGSVLANSTFADVAGGVFVGIQFGGLDNVIGYLDVGIMGIKTYAEVTTRSDRFILEESGFAQMIRIGMDFPLGQAENIRLGLYIGGVRGGTANLFNMGVTIGLRF